MLISFYWWSWRLPSNEVGEACILSGGFLRKEKFSCGNNSLWFTSIAVQMGWFTSLHQVRQKRTFRWALFCCCCAGDASSTSGQARDGAGGKDELWDGLLCTQRKHATCLSLFRLVAAQFIEIKGLETCFCRLGSKLSAISYLWRRPGLWCHSCYLPSVKGSISMLCWQIHLRLPVFNKTEVSQRHKFNFGLSPWTETFWSSKLKALTVVTDVCN